MPGEKWHLRRAGEEAQPHQHLTQFLVLLCSGDLSVRGADAASSSLQTTMGSCNVQEKIKQNDTKEGLAAASLLSFLGLFAKLHWAKSNFWDCLSGSWFSRNQLWEGRGTGRLVAAVLP